MRHSIKKRDNVAKSRPGSNTAVDMSPHCTAHDEWLIMKLCIHVGFSDSDSEIFI